ncbi:MAG: alkaline phosphatase [Bacteroidota bacterium]
MRLYTLLFLTLFLIAHTPVQSQDTKQVRNVILLIPDGTSTSVLSLARWYKYAQSPSDNCKLAVDPYICGLVHTYSSDAPIGDSAPTSSCYATGMPSQTGFVATYPVSVAGRDLVKLDPSRAYQPLTTVLEAAKLKKKSTGIVVTCHFPHATPADFSAHTPERDLYFPIATQMVYNNLDVMMGGGQNYLDPKVRTDGQNLVNVLKKRGYTVANNVKGFKALNPRDTLVWSLLTKEDFPYDLDRKFLNDSLPSLETMTNAALRILNQNPNGFFLMVEGSKIDWAAHANDPTGIITEFLAFDDAVKAALSFARIDGNTAVIVCPDHGNSGISMGNSGTNKGYDTISLKNIYGPVLTSRITNSAFYSQLTRSNKTPGNEEIRATYKSEFGINDATDKEIKSIGDSIKSPKMVSRYALKALNSRTNIGFTTTGHTGEDVFLAMYHPRNYRLNGLAYNTDINKYICEVLNLPSLDSLTKVRFVIDTTLLKGFVFNLSDSICKGKSNDDHYGKIEIKKDKKSSKRAVIKGNTDFVTIYDGKKSKEIRLGSICPYVYIEKTGTTKDKTFKHIYLPHFIVVILENEL